MISCCLKSHPRYTGWQSPNGRWHHYSKVTHRKFSTWPYNCNVTSRYWSTKHPFHLWNRQQIYFAHIGSKRRPWTMVRTILMAPKRINKHDSSLVSGNVGDVRTSYTKIQIAIWIKAWVEIQISLLSHEIDLWWFMYLKNRINCTTPYQTNTHISGTELHRPLDLGFEPWRSCAPQQLQPRQNVKKKHRNLTAVARPTGAVTARAKLSWKCPHPFLEQILRACNWQQTKTTRELRFTVLDLMKVLEMTNQNFPNTW